MISRMPPTMSTPRSIVRAARMQVALRGLAAAAAVALVSVAAAGCSSAGTPSGQLAIGVAPAGTALVAGSPPGSTARAGRIELHAARGEAESAWLLVTRPAADTVVEVEVRRGSLPDSVAVRLYEGRSLAVTRPSPGGRTGSFVDPLVPLRGTPEGGAPTGADEPVDRTYLLDHEAGTRLGVLVDVSVGRSTAAGSYEGSLRVRERGGRALVAPMHLTIHDVTLPARPTLDSSIGVDESQVVRLERVPARSDAFHEAYDRYVEALLAARLTPADIAATPDVGESPDRFVRTAAGRRLTRLLADPRATRIRVPLYATWPYRDPLGADRSRTIAYLRGVASLLRERGAIDRGYVYVHDEPADGDAAAVRDLRALVRSADPRLRVLVTREPRRALRGGADIWAANVGPSVDRRAIAREHAGGREYWWYPSISTHPPYPSLFLDDARPSGRALGWLAYASDVDGFLLWSATHWHEVDDPFADAATYRDPSTGAIGNGDGVLLYPGDPVGVAGPVPSVRLLALRDGVEDHDLLTLAEARVGRREVDALVAGVAPALDRFAQDPHRWTDAHERLLALAAGDTGGASREGAAGVRIM